MKGPIFLQFQRVLIRQQWSFLGILVNRALFQKHKISYNSEKILDVKKILFGNRHKTKTFSEFSFLDILNSTCDKKAIKDGQNSKSQKKSDSFFCRVMLQSRSVCCDFEELQFQVVKAMIKEKNQRNLFFSSVVFKPFLPFKPEESEIAVFLFKRV